MSGSRDHPHSALFIPEILDRIFKLVEKKDLPHIARVCKIWSGNSLPVFWSEVNDLPLLFSILSPLSFVEDNQQVYSQKAYFFSRGLSFDDWQRFDKYASCVRTFTYDPSSFRHIGYLARDVFTDIAASRPRIDIFCKLHALVWISTGLVKRPNDLNLSDAFLFMSPNVKSFTFSWGLSDDTSRADFLCGIPRRMPNLTHLELRCTLPTTSVNRLSAQVVRLCSDLLNLKSVVLPRVYLTDQIFMALSKLPRLQTIDVPATDSVRGGVVAAAALKFTPIITRHGFPELINLASIASFSQFDNVLNSEWTTPNLRRLTLYSQVTAETPQSLHGLLQSISAKHSHLQTLILVPVTAPPSTIEGSDMQGDCIILDTLRPILRMTSLCELEIRYAHHAHLSALDVKHFLVSLPNIEVFLLNETPIYLNESSLGLDVLSVVAHHCGRLRHLGLFVDASLPITRLSPDAMLTHDHFTATLDPFPALEQLSLGASIITAEVANSVALHLSRFLPTTCDLETGGIAGFMTQRQTEPAKEYYRKIAQRNATWKKVKELVPLFAQARQEERDKARLMIQKNGAIR